jgi:hypothetical protein
MAHLVCDESGRSSRPGPQPARRVILRLRSVNGHSPAEVIERTVDLATRQLQQISELIGRSPFVGTIAADADERMMSTSGATPSHGWRPPLWPLAVLVASVIIVTLLLALVWN